MKQKVLIVMNKENVKLGIFQAPEMKKWPIYLIVIKRL